MTLRPNQLRAARGLLNISQSALAVKTGVAATSLRQFELGNTRLQNKTEDALMAFFEPLVEFIGDRGVALREDTIRVLEGEDAFQRMLEDVFTQLHGKPDEEAVFLAIDPSSVTKGVAQAWQPLINAGVRCRHIGKQAGFPEFYENRTPPDDCCNATLQVAYGNFVAQQIAANKILLICSKPLADSLRQTFSVLWLASTFLEAESDGKPAPSERRRRVKLAGNA